MPERKPPTSIGKDILFIAGFFLLFLGAGGWLVYSLGNRLSATSHVTADKKKRG